MQINIMWYLNVWAHFVERSEYIVIYHWTMNFYKCCSSNIPMTIEIAHFVVEPHHSQEHYQFFVCIFAVFKRWTTVMMFRLYIHGHDNISLHYSNIVLFTICINSFWCRKLKKNYNFKDLKFDEVLFQKEQL